MTQKIIIFVSIGKLIKGNCRADVTTEFIYVPPQVFFKNSTELIKAVYITVLGGYFSHRDKISLTTTMQFDYWSKDLNKRKLLFTDVIGYHQSV